MSGEATKDREEFVTILICNNHLLATGLEILLANTRFVLSKIGADDEPPSRRLRVYTRPDLFIVDANRASEEVLNIIKLLKVQQPEARIAVVADHFDMSFVRFGIDGFCLATSDREVLIKSLELIMMGESTMPLRLVRSMLDEMALKSEPDQDRLMAEPLPLDPTMHKLSNREAEILTHVMSGEPNKIIARKLALTEATVKVHIKAILRKIGAANRTQAAMWAKEHLTTRSGNP
jgi:two-component system nitrate/nitrite response regulator NarL